MNDNRLELIRKTASNGFMNSSLVRDKSLIDNYQKQDDDIKSEIIWNVTYDFVRRSVAVFIEDSVRRSISNSIKGYKTASNGFMNSPLVRDKSLIGNENKYFDSYQKQDDDIKSEIIWNVTYDSVRRSVAVFIEDSVRRSISNSIKGYEF